MRKREEKRERERERERNSKGEVTEKGISTDLSASLPLWNIEC